MAVPVAARMTRGGFSLVFGPTTLARAIADAKGLLADSAGQLARLRESAGGWRAPAHGPALVAAH